MMSEVVHSYIWEDYSPDDDIIDGEVVDGEDLPDIGHDMAPSSEMIVMGRIGNGTHDSFTPELAKRIQLERRQNADALKASRKEAYEEGMKDALARIASFEKGILDIGIELMKRLDKGEPLTRKEVDTLKLAQKTAVEMKDRAMGRSKTTAEVKTQKSILHLIAGITPDE